MTGHLSNGLYYNEGGDPNGEPLVFVHGAGFNTDIFDSVFPVLGQKYRVIAYDRRGYGRSYRIPNREFERSWTIQHMEDLRLVLDELNAAPAHIVAWSAGGIYASIFAARFPHYVRRLVLYEPPLYKPGHITLSLAFEFSRLTAAKSRGRFDEAARIFLRMVLGYDKSNKNSFDTLPESILSTIARDANVVVEELNRIDNSLCWNNLPNVRVPITLMTGEQSIPLFRSITADLLSGVVPSASVAVIPGGNHIAHFDMPDEFSQSLIQALQ